MNIGALSPPLGGRDAARRAAPRRRVACGSCSTPLVQARPLPHRGRQADLDPPGGRRSSVGCLAELAMLWARRPRCGAWSRSSGGRRRRRGRVAAARGSRSGRGRHRSRSTRSPTATRMLSDGGRPSHCRVDHGRRAACLSRSSVASSRSTVFRSRNAAEAHAAFGITGRDRQGAHGRGPEPRRPLRRARRARTINARRACEGSS